eukprot:TRINITY_DN15932_c1_g2_i2.p1 TRINITY_DN15932_c1_g2~~TRINITY_DN15932_c1_g2_i2.p1  ORF type:complete len:231 (+),score=2.79 TRINITY_DN15932_c1_g2_i2:112-804(+)
MTQLKRASWVAVFGCLIAGLMGQAAFAHGGGGGHGGGGHSGGGHMGGGGHSGGGHHYGGGGYYGGGYYGGMGLGYGLGYGLGGYGYNSPVWYNRQGYYSPPVQGYPVYSNPQYTVPQYTVSPVSTVPAPDGGEIVLFVAADAPAGIQYTLNGQPYSLKPGESQRLVNDRLWTIEFPPTANAQVALRYSLVSARYKFKASGTGMGLFQTQDDAPAAVAAPILPPVPNPPAN